MWLFFLLMVIGALSALGLGILTSVAASNEFQVMQFIPVVITPQVILGGTFVPVADLPVWARAIAEVMPVTYLLEGLNHSVLGMGSLGDYWIAFGVLAAWTVASILLAALTIRRG